MADQPACSLSTLRRGVQWLHRRRSQKRYMVAFGLLVALAISDRLIVQRSIEFRSGDGSVINLAGRQRMLSQKLAKAALIVANSMDAANRRPALAELEHTADEWAAGHLTLQRSDAGAGFRPPNTAAIRALYAEIQPHHETVLRTTRELVGRLSPDQAAPTREDWRAIVTILRGEAAFLGGMDAIVKQYELDDRHSLDLLRRIEAVLAAAIVLTLAAESLLSCDLRVTAARARRRTQARAA